MAELLQDSQALESTTVGIYRTATVVKGGRRFSFAALVVVGDRRGSVGIGYGKAPGVPAAIEKAQKDARKRLFKIELKGGTLPHPVTGRFSASKVLLIPAAPGTGVIAGGTTRAVLEMAGVHDCLSKAHGSTNKKNLCKAVMDGLRQLQTRNQIADLRGVELEMTDIERKIEADLKAKAEAKAEAAPVTKTTGNKPQTAPVQPVPAADTPVTETPASEDVSTPKEQVSGDAAVEQPQPEASTGESEEPKQS